MTTQTTGLACPTCGYDLTALTAPRCPECGQRFEIRSRPPARPVPVDPRRGIEQGYLALFDWGCLDRRQPIWAVGAGMLGAAVTVLFIVWVVSR